MTDRELMQMALDALDSDNPHIQVGAAISLRYRLAQPVHAIDISQERVDENPKDRHEWVGLDDDEVNEMSRFMVKADKSVEWLSRRIEAKLKEKNGG